METEIQNPDPDWQKMSEEWHKRRQRGKVLGGIVLVGVGIVFLAKQLGVIFPEWLFTWKVMLIVIGLFMGLKHSFRNPGWLIPVAIGSAFLVGDFYPEMHISNMFWPVLIICVGLFMIFRPRRRHEWQRWEGRWRDKWEKHHRRHQHHHNHFRTETSQDDLLETVSVFGQIKKNIISKDFKGGEVNCVFGGAVINLTQADITGKVVLEMNAVFGGVKLIVPSHWTVQTGELVTVLGGIEDKRPVQGININADKVLVLRGTAIFGGMEILN